MRGPGRNPLGNGPCPARRVEGWHEEGVLRGLDMTPSSLLPVGGVAGDAAGPVRVVILEAGRLGEELMALLALRALLALGTGVGTHFTHSHRT